MSDILIDRPELASLGTYEFGWSDSDVAGAAAERGISPEVVRNISALKNEPEWMLKNRLKGLEVFLKKPMPAWGADLSGLDFDNIKYFVRSTAGAGPEMGRPARRHQERPTRSSASRRPSARTSSPA